MAKFDGGKYKDGILSYNYLSGKGGEGKGGVFIKQFKGRVHKQAELQYLLDLLAVIFGPEKKSIVKVLYVNFAIPIS